MLSQLSDARCVRSGGTTYLEGDGIHATECALSTDTARLLWRGLLKASPAWANVIILALRSELETEPCGLCDVLADTRGAESRERKDWRPRRLLRSVSLVPHILECFDRTEEALEEDDVVLLVVLVVFLLTILSDLHKREGVKLRPDEPVSGPWIELNAIACCAE